VLEVRIIGFNGLSGILVHLRRGEILGFAGLWCRAHRSHGGLMGMPPGRGRILLHGKPM
jgi:ABC-type sugar transport system ATPase subunit